MATHIAPAAVADDRAALGAWAARQACPCGHTGLRIEWRLAARPLGDYSLAGAQMKFSARETPWLVCPADAGGCGDAAPGHH